MKIILVGAKGKIGSNVLEALEGPGHEIIPVGKTSGRLHVDLESRESIRGLYGKVGKFDAVVSAAGHVSFAPLAQLGPEEWKHSLGSKLLGQIQLAQEALPFLNDRGSITLVSGVLSDEFIPSGVAATVVNRAIEGFAQAAAIELPRGIRINVISPTLLKESEKDYEGFFPGFVAVEGWKVGQAFKKSVMGAETGRIYKVL